MKTGIGYARVSTPDQSERGSHENQIILIEKWFKSNNIILEHIYVDEAEHGWDLDRKEFRKMLKHLETVDMLVVENDDRFSRADPLDTLIIWREIAQKGKVTMSIMEGAIDMNTLEGQLLAHVRAYRPAKELQVSKEKQKRGIERYKEREGRWGRRRKELNIKLWFELKDNISLQDMADVQKMSKPTLIERLKEAKLYEYPEQDRIPALAQAYIEEKASKEEITSN